LYILGRIAEEGGSGDRARKNYADAITPIESMRTGLQTASIRSEFLADKRDVYDALIDLRLNDKASADDVFELIEHSRARALNERVSLGSFGDLRAIQSHLDANSILLDFWTGANSVSAVWISSSQAGIVRHAGRIEEAAAKLITALRGGSHQWPTPAANLVTPFIGRSPRATRDRCYRWSPQHTSV
jgi:hypothetical protein